MSWPLSQYRFFLPSPPTEFVKESGVRPLDYLFPIVPSLTGTTTVQQDDLLVLQGKIMLYLSAGGQGL